MMLRMAFQSNYSTTKAIYSSIQKSQIMMNFNMSQNLWASKIHYRPTVNELIWMNLWQNYYPENRDENYCLCKTLDIR